MSGRILEEVTLDDQLNRLEDQVKRIKSKRIVDFDAYLKAMAIRREIQTRKRRQEYAGR